MWIVQPRREIAIFKQLFEKTQLASRIQIFIKDCGVSVPESRLADAADVHAVTKAPSAVLAGESRAMTMSLRTKWLTGSVIAVAGILAVAWLQLLSLERFLASDLERTTTNLRMFAAAALSEPLTAGAPTTLHHILAAPEVEGLEIFSGQGRRIWSGGEPLELIAYRLDRDTELTHHASEGARYELFWPATQLGGSYGLAVRLDTAWQDRVRREMMIAISAGLAVFGGLVMLLSRTLLVPAASISPKGEKSVGEVAPPPDI